MAKTLTWLLVAWMVACGGGTLGSDRDAVEDDAADGDDPAVPGVTPVIPEDPLCGYTIDGRFTGWDGPGDATHEWSSGERVEGVFGIMHADLCGERLIFLNDWLLNDKGAIAATSYNLFYINLEGGLFELRLYGDQHLDVWWNGQPYDGWFEGATTFSASPDAPEVPHTIFEFALELPMLGEFAVNEADPPGCSGGGTGSGGTTGGDGGLVQEPVSLKGTLGGDDDLAIAGTEDLPFILSIDPPAGPVGALVTLQGLHFGDVPDEVRVDAEPAEVVSWDDHTIRFRVPAVPEGPVFVRVRVNGHGSPKVPFVVNCTPYCLGMECGDDGCGGQCGECPAGPWLCAAGRCYCVPACNGLECGADGCGGSCGACGGGESCVGGTCVCVPDCEDRHCGDDGCGGSCGTCEAGLQCVGFLCACAPDCGGRNCGSDGCGGSCGVCPGGAGWSCVEGICECAASCVGKACGSDGCGGSCGACASGLTCQAGQCTCVPSCAGAQCGSDGCGGSCGTCAEGQACVGGACVCLPQCDGLQCGDDGCGGSCGTCPEGQECAKNGLCHAP